MRHEHFPDVSECAAHCGGDRIELRADVRVGAGTWQKVRITELSTTGFEIAWVRNAGNARELLVRLSGLEVMRAWAHGTADKALRCTFERPLSPCVVEHLVRSARERQAL